MAQASKRDLNIFIMFEKLSDAIYVKGTLFIPPALISQFSGYKPDSYMDGNMTSPYQFRIIFAGQQILIQWVLFFQKPRFR